MRIYFTRHGESQANLLHEISNRGLRHPLTAAGRRQASALGEQLAGLSAIHGAITRLYSSPSLRAIETSIVVVQRLEIDYEVTDALREFDCGQAEGRSDEAAWEQWHWVVAEWRAGHWDRRIAGGESFNDLRARFVPFVEGLVQQYRDSPAGIVCVSHGGLYGNMLPQVLSNLGLERIAALKLAYTTCIEAELGPEGLACAAWNGLKL